MEKNNIIIPADVPKTVAQIYINNYNAITCNTGRLFLFACDQKIEHLNADFHGAAIAPNAQDPRHIFEIASKGRIGALATHLGLIAHYAKQYTNIRYIVKLNGKTNLIRCEHQDPLSTELWTVDDVLRLQQESDIPIHGIGYTIYMGSLYESTMLEQAAQAIFQAHQHGLIAILWVYPRGSHITDEHDPELSAGATGLAASLGADFVKIKAPENIADLRRACVAAGNTKVICSGGALQEEQHFLRTLYEQIHEGNTSGCAIGRNIFQKSLPEAIAFTHAIAKVVFDDNIYED